MRCILPQPKIGFPVLMIAGFLLLIVYGCKKVINVDLRNAQPLIVIEGEVTNEPGNNYVRITKSVSFSTDNNFPAVSGATVSIKDSLTGFMYSMNETDTGFYTTTQLSGIPNHTYILSVDAGGKHYGAVSTMPATVGLDSVTFIANAGFGSNQISAVANFQDKAGVSNYYQFEEYLNGKQVPDIFVFEDRLSDGRYIEQPLFNDSTYLQKGDTLQLKMYCIDQGVYNYFFTLLNVSGNNNFQAATPANPISNISNGSLGYFSAHTVNQTKLLVY